MHKRSMYEVKLKNCQFEPQNVFSCLSINQLCSFHNLVANAFFIFLEHFIVRTLRQLHVVFLNENINSNGYRGGDRLIEIVEKLTRHFF